VFSNNELTSVTIPNHITVIEEGAFSANRLTSVTISNSVTTIGTWAFSGNQLASVTIPDSVTTIGVGAFERNPLTGITIGGDVELVYNSSYAMPTAFDNNFDNAYKNNGRQAGTYTLNNGAWSLPGLQGLGFYVGYVHDTDMDQLAGRSKIKYGDGGETVIIYSNVDLYEFKIFNNGADYLSGDVNVARNVLSASTYLEYMTTIPEGMPAEAVHFITGAGEEYYYQLGYSGMDGTVVAIRVEG